MNFQVNKAIQEITSAIHDVQDFPQPGVVFRDITPVLLDSKLFRDTVLIFAERYRDKQLDKIAAVDARGFIFGAALAYELDLGFVLIRKGGKLPRQTFSESYFLEYGSSTLEVHADSFHGGKRTVLIDDILATGGTAAAAASLVKKAGGDLVEIAFLIEIMHLKGREKLGSLPMYSAIKID